MCSQQKYGNTIFLFYLKSQNWTEIKQNNLPHSFLLYYSILLKFNNGQWQNRPILFFQVWSCIIFGKLCGWDISPTGASEDKITK